MFLVTVNSYTKTKFTNTGRAVYMARSGRRTEFHSNFVCTHKERCAFTTVILSAHVRGKRTVRFAGR
jgi:hypothetical protein